MIKKYFYLLVIALCSSLLLTSCGTDNDIEIYIVDENWQSDNEKVFADIATNSAYKEIKSQSNAGSIYYKELEPKSPVVPSNDTIYFSSKVKVYYFGVSMDETSREMEYLFDSADYPNQSAATFSVSGVVDGFATALQHMHPGDRWEIWIPWQLGYGSTGNISSNQSVRPWAYSTLKFEVEVVEIVEE
jgi:FKBP-type peptidyl-prolyl cis-trans isomerase